METLDLPENDGPGAYHSYLDNSSAPLTCFLFALPLFIVYHAGLWFLNNFSDLRWANTVDIAIADALGRLGMAGPLLSFLFVVLCFLIMHAWSGKPWHWPPLSTWFLMMLESLVLALPVFLLSRLVVSIVSFLPLSAASGEGGGEVMSWQASMVLSCGAGVYEEFFFRVVVMGLMILFFDKVLGVKGSWKYAVAAILQALLFSASHHLPGGPEEITNLEELRRTAPVFLFRTLAGIYFAFIYIERGFGIAAGSHAGYDLMVVLLDVFDPVEAV